MLRQFELHPRKRSFYRSCYVSQTALRLLERLTLKTLLVKLTNTLLIEDVAAIDFKRAPQKEQFDKRTNAWCTRDSGGNPIQISGPHVPVTSLRAGVLYTIVVETWICVVYYRIELPHSKASQAGLSIEIISVDRRFWNVVHGFCNRRGSELMGPQEAIHLSKESRN